AAEGGDDWQVIGLANVDVFGNVSKLRLQGRQQSRHWQKYKFKINKFITYLLLDSYQSRLIILTPCGMCVIGYLETRPPLFIFSGDVGTWKTALARSFGAEVAKSLSMSLWLYPLSLQSRGSGAVGEMTQLITGAFAEIVETAKRFKATKKGVILLIDEADAIVQSRALSQMHHEDRAGVNAVLRGIDELAGKRLPVIIVMCTNRSESIDPAVKRRAAAIFEFTRPSKSHREYVLRQALAGLNINESDLGRFVELTGDGPGYTFSDFTQRLFPTIVLNSFPDQGVDVALIENAISSVQPTPPFVSED
ncbi:MAG: hypothetical protein ACI9R3_006422, partial [Verrucomicrobiales bacterium]